MNIQSLQISVPNKGCPNNCYFCVSKNHPNQYSDYISDIDDDGDIDYISRLKFAKEQNCNSVVLTGAGEPLENIEFMDLFFHWNKKHISFEWIELQTCGVGLDDKILKYLKRNKVKVISLSLSGLNSNSNAMYNRTPISKIVKIKELCDKIKEFNFTLRLSLNLTDLFDSYPPEYIFDMCKAFGANQATLKQLYYSDIDTKINDWIKKHKLNDQKFNEIITFVNQTGNPLEFTSLGLMRYSINEMSIVIDKDCMSRKAYSDKVRYLILREDCKLYTKWDDKGSILF